MKAIVQDQYGPIDDVLQLRDVDTPQVGDDEVLVRVRAASVHADVWHVVTGRPYAMRLFGAGLFRPKNPIPGTDVAGHVEQVGKNVTQFKPGDAVFGETHAGMQWKNGGAFAEYVSAPASVLVLKPESISFEQAAAVPTSGLIALNNLGIAGRVQAGQRVLINGAGGGVGAFAVQLAKASGAEVTGVDCAEKLDLVRSLGADFVIDYRERDFTKSGERYDLILDVASTLELSACKRALTPDGKYVLIGHDHYGIVGNRMFGSLPHTFKLMAMSPFVRQLPKVDFSFPSKQESMTTLKRLIDERKLIPTIDRTFPLSEVTQAMRYLAEAHVLGKVVLTT